MRALQILGVIALVGVIGLAIGWYGTGSRTSVGSSTHVTARPAANQTPASLSTPAKPSVFGTQPGSKIAQTNVLSAVTSNSIRVPTNALKPANLITNWEDRLDDVLAGDQPEADKAKALLQIFPNLPEEGQVEVAQHLTNLIDDEHYAPLGSYLTNTALPEEVLDVLLSDVLNRPNATKIPALVGVARDPKNPKASEAKDILEMFLEEDYGDDWDLWQKKAEAWLKDNPD